MLEAMEGSKEQMDPFSSHWLVVLVWDEAAHCSPTAGSWLSAGSFNRISIVRLVLLSNQATDTMSLIYSTPPGLLALHLRLATGQSRWLGSGPKLL